MIFSSNFNNPIEKITLIIGNKFNKPIDTLLCLAFGFKFNQPIDHIILPKSLTFLELGENFDYPLDFLPVSLQIVDIAGKYKHTLDNLPHI
ncbi:hypothetical protein crov066 [Cafeteria roenbergensis virus]|uniref:Uncharacterized protein n=1 Tax=Cafeteria roenbergensis virus (strain BV-PW1) TaxID=693272 RepID=E3T4I6_CROVB|nr:hypothetical protein crov066 [Cafeteria roenbergensis virus BV-PW1]ADO67099.1 hypothetical protein crov066 [Cafeteria roenbergensis virus BV-PW1]